MSSDRPIGAPATMHSGAKVAIRAQAVCKAYRVGSTSGMYRYRSLREDIVSRMRRNGAASDERLAWALKDVTFDVAEGETLGVIGRNGAGKSTLFKVLSKITPPTSGHAEIRGRLGSLLEVGTGFHPELTGRENIMLSGAILGMRRGEILSRLDEIIDFSGIDRFLDTPVKRYSSGMYLRLAFAVAAHLEPDVLLVDEVLAVGDADFQRKCLGKMAEVGASGRTVLFVSHSMQSVARLCPRVILLDQGQILADGPAVDVIRTYMDSGVGGAQRTWASPDQAPGDNVARLKSVRVLDAAQRASEEIDIRSPLDIEIEYWRLTTDPDHRLCAAIQVTNESGTTLFVSSDLHGQVPCRRGSPTVVRSTCRIPGNFMAEGRFTVQAGVMSFLGSLVAHAVEPDAVAFHVVDRSTGDGVRGPHGGEWPGVVRPMFDWTLEEVEPYADRLGHTGASTATAGHRSTGSPADET